MRSRSAFRLSLMMFLQYAIWGAWAPILSLHLIGLPDFTKTGANTGWLISLVYMTMAIASMVAPVAGQLADRYFATEKFLAFSHLVGGALIIWVFFLESFWGIFLVMLLHTLLYAPTVGLTNSIALHHLPNSERDFGRIRLWGTIGWIVIAWIFALWLGLADGVIELISPAARESVVNWRENLPAFYKPRVGQTLLVAGGLSFLLAMFCLTLPHTPPTKRTANPFAFLGAVKLMRNPSFAVLMVVAFLVSTELQFYYVFTPNFFNQGGGPWDNKEIAAALLKQRETQAMYDSNELVKQWDEKKLVLWDQRTLSREELEKLKPGIKESLLSTVYAVRAQRDADEMVYIGDAPELGGNGDGKLSRGEFERLKALRSKDIELLVPVVDKQLETARAKLDAATEKATIDELQRRVDYLEKRKTTIYLMMLSELVDRKRAATDEAQRHKLTDSVYEWANRIEYFRNQAAHAAELATFAAAGVVALDQWERLRKETAKEEERALYEAWMIELRKRLDRPDDRRPTLAKVSVTAGSALAYFDSVQDVKGGLKLDQAWVGPVMTFGQIAEVLVLLIVPWSLRRLGFRITITIGIFAWCLRYMLFSLGYPQWLIISSQALHGFGFGFFFVGAFLYADAISTPDIRASTQSFIIFVTYGAGMLVSSLIAGRVYDLCDGNWHMIFMVPAIITFVCTLLFVLGFRDPPRTQAQKPKDPLTEFIERAERRYRD